MPKFTAEVQRASYRSREFTVEAGSHKRAKELLLEAAANHDFNLESESHAVYTVGPIMKPRP